MKNDAQLEALILSRLAKLNQKFKWIINAKVSLRVESFKDTVRDKLCGIDLSVPGPDIFTKSYQESFEAAIAAAFMQLELQLKKHKAKLFTGIR